MFIEDTVFMLIKDEQNKEEQLRVIKQILAKNLCKDYVLETVCL